MNYSSARRLGLVSALIVPFGFTVAPSARAMDAEVTSDTAAQFYDVRSPTGETVLNRRRLTSMLGVSAYNLFDAPQGDPTAAEYSFRARVRYDADYGASGAEADPTQFASVIPGFQNNVVDLMYAYIEGRRLAHGWLGFKLGRQYITDMLGWWSFDGGEVNVTTPYYIKAEAYGGLEERGGMPLSLPRFQADGIWTGSRSNFDPSLYPSFQPAEIAPAYGVALESAGVTWIHGRLDYRRVYNTGPSNTTEFASDVLQPNIYNATRISTDRFGYSMDANWSQVGGAKAGLVYDLYRGDFTSIYGTLEAYLGTKVTVGVDYDYYVPSFDADSIWNFFAGEPSNDISLRGNVDVTDKISVAAGGNVRIMTVQTATNNPPSPLLAALGPALYPTNGHPFDDGFNVSARYRTGETTLALRASGDFGDEGDRVGADLSGERIIETRYLLSARVGIWQWDDKLQAQPFQDTTTFNYVLGAGYRFASRTTAKAEWEHDISPLVGQRFRLLLLLNVAVGK